MNVTDWGGLISCVVIIGLWYVLFSIPFTQVICYYAGNLLLSFMIYHMKKIAFIHSAYLNYRKMNASDFMQLGISLKHFFKQVTSVFLWRHCIFHRSRYRINKIAVVTDDDVLPLEEIICNCIFNGMQDIMTCRMISSKSS